jgi:hypothetical protein
LKAALQRNNVTKRMTSQETFETTCRGEKASSPSHPLKTFQIIEQSEMGGALQE